MALRIRMKSRDWDFWTPILLGDVSSQKIDLQLTRVMSLIDNVAEDPECEAAEMSLSRYAMRRNEGRDQNLVGIPFFIMRGFRNRCILTLKDSPLKTLGDLKGVRMGISGWQDSGNTWTRALLLEAGVPVESIRWTLSRMTSADKIDMNRGRQFWDNRVVFHDPDETPLVDLLRAGKIDAIFQAFMPAGFYSPDYGLRQVQPDFVEQEKAWYGRWGFVPGIHILAMKADFVEAHPEAPLEFCKLLRASQDLWLAKRRKYFETTPWLIASLEDMAQSLPADWDPYGLEPNRKMLDEFARQQYVQKLTSVQRDADFLFPVKTI
ncbi:MAG: nitrate ABC transporter substrate-binding protein [Sutterellaceae bacterium]|nr:nitrate ABC transporter substrate-binding protein [Sutterellaceae bacterium]